MTEIKFEGVEVKDYSETSKANREAFFSRSLACIEEKVRNAYNVGRNDGVAEKKKAVEEAFEKGYQKGLAENADALAKANKALADVNDRHWKGRLESFEKGIEEGKKDPNRYNEGYCQGYEEGYAAGEEAVLKKIDRSNADDTYKRMTHSHVAWRTYNEGFTTAIQLIRENLDTLEQEQE